MNLQLYPGNRYGLVGANGAGKTSFARLLNGELDPTTGEVRMAKENRIGVLLQNQFAFEKRRIIDVVLEGKTRLWQTLSKKRDILEKASRREMTVEEGETLAELEGELAELDAYRADADAEKMLMGLGLEKEIHENPMKTLSGGYKIRVLMARMLFSDPDVLILDEPNNHLDLESIRWLAKYLLEFKGLAVLISHDHLLIDRVSTHVLDVDYREIRLYKGNYFRFVEQKKAAEEIKLKEISSQEKKKAEMEKFIERFSAKSSKARQANSKKKIVEKMEIGEIVRSSRRPPRFRFETVRPSGRMVCKARNVAKSFGEKKVLGGLNFTLERGRRMALLGYNGAGKSTLLKILAGKIKPEAGEVEWGHETRVGYFAQNHRELVGNDETPFGWLSRFTPGESVSAIRSLLGLMLFSGDEVDKPASALSGGELSRLVFARLTHEKNNVLLLDEPTNHLDLEGIEALIGSLAAYEGTLIFASHDEYFVGKLADSVLHFDKEGAMFWDDDYESFRSRWLEGERTPPPTPRKHKTGGKSSYERQKKVRRLENQNKKLEKRIAELEAKDKDLEKKLYGSGSFDDGSEKLVVNEKKALEIELEKLFGQWEDGLKRMETMQAESTL